MDSGVVSTYFGFIDSIEPDGDYAVTMHLKMPYAQLYQSLSNPAAVIVSKKAVEATGENFAKNPVGTGAYKLKEWKEADSITLEAFDGYWGEPAKTANVIFKVIPEGSQRTIMLENGEADIAYAILPNDAGRIEEDQNLTMIHEPGYKSMLFYLKCDSEEWPVSDKRVRQAIQYAINKQEIVDSVIYGYGQVGSLYCTPLTDGYNADKDKGDMYDPEKAKALLAEAGYADGFDLDFYCQSAQTYEEIAAILQAQLAEVGINVNIITMESNTINEKVYSGEEIPIRMGFYNNLCGSLDLVMQKLLPTAYGQVYFNDEVETLMNEARSKTDSVESQKVYDKFLDLMNEDSPWITIYYEETMIGRSNKVDGFELNPVGAHQLKTVTVYE
jgi:peptide/nickel transport system substrate-binding protein